LLQLVNVGHKSLGDYATLVSRGLMDEIRRLAEPLQGARVVHVSATAFGGGVAEINYTLVPLMADAGLDVEWRIIRGADEFFAVTKAIHNGLQGDSRSLSAEERETFARFCALDLRPHVIPVGALRPGSIGRQPGILIREDEDRYLFLFGWATGEYMWSTVADAAGHLGGGPIGVDALVDTEATRA